MTATVIAPRPARWSKVEGIVDLEPSAVCAQGWVPHRGVAVGVGSCYANPFEPAYADDVARVGALMRYAVWLSGNSPLLESMRPLRGRDLACQCPVSDPGCHRRVLLDVCNPPPGPGGDAMGLTVRRPWASLLLVPGQFGGKTVDNRSWSTDYRGPVLIYGGTRVDEAGLHAARAANLDADWHVEQQGWLGGAVLTDVHLARRGCCRPWGRSGRRDRPNYHWVFAHPHRLARRPWAQRGFEGLRATSWSVLLHGDAHRILHSVGHRNEMNQ
jgi:hypothetical protein